MRCTAAFHRDCWVFNGRCGIYGCGCTTYVGFRENTSTELVKIDDTTSVPVSFAPYIEALTRKIPKWGKRLVPATAVGVSGSVVVSALYFTLIGMPFDMTMQLIFLGMGFFYSLISVPMGALIKRHPERVSIVFGIISSVFYIASRSAFYTQRAVLVATAVTAAMMFCNGLAERITAPYKFTRKPGPVAMGVIRSILTAVFLFLFLSLLTFIKGPWPVSSYLAEIAIVSLLGLFVAAPPLEISKSAMLKRLEAGGDEDDSF
jgi:hypothetical protein